MPEKKRTTKKSKKVSPLRTSRRILIIKSDTPVMLNGIERDSNGRKQPYCINPETDEQREKRLAARKALTLKAARIAYENHHRRKAS